MLRRWQARAGRWQARAGREPGPLVARAGPSGRAQARAGPLKARAGVINFLRGELIPGVTVPKHRRECGSTPEPANGRNRSSNPFRAPRSPLNSVNSERKLRRKVSLLAPHSRPPAHARVHFPCSRLLAWIFPGRAMLAPARTCSRSSRAYPACAGGQTPVWPEKPEQPKRLNNGTLKIFFPLAESFGKNIGFWREIR
jgi:hypothetical protein